MLALVKSALLAGTLSIGFIVPFIDYYTHHDLLVKTSVFNTLDHAVEPAALLSPFLDLVGMSNSLGNDLQNEMPLGIGWNLLFIVPLAIAMYAVPTFRKPQSNGVRPWILLTCITAALFLFLTTYLFPWGYDGSLRILVAIINELKVIQFSWRFLGVATLTLVCLGCLVASYGDKRIRVALVACLALSLLECGYATGTFVRQIDRQPEINVTGGIQSLFMSGEYLCQPIDPFEFEDSWPNNEFVPKPDSDEVMVSDFEHTSP